MQVNSGRRKFNGNDEIGRVSVNRIELSLVVNRLRASCREMGATLRRAALSPNIKDRLDFSCAVFDSAGELCAQAAHIPVHLGSMAYAMRDVIGAWAWREGDMVVVNDPYLGGTHLPDVTVIAPVFSDSRLLAFVANRAHHADIGCARPGSMPLARTLADEGLVLSPRLLSSTAGFDPATLALLESGLRNPAATLGDFAAQISANRVGCERVAMLHSELGAHGFNAALDAVNAYGSRLARHTIANLPDGVYRYTDYMDGDGFAAVRVPIAVTVTITGDHALVDFDGTAHQVEGNINCPLSVTAAAAFYAFFALMPPTTPPCAGSLSVLTLLAPHGTLLNARAPAAVAAGNVETSQRIVDVVLGALAQAIPERIPAASHGSMNNVALGGPGWDYYETIGGGSGAHRLGAGLDAVHTHMTNTLNTPAEVIEMNYPLRIRRYAIRRGSGGDGRHRGGDGIVREFEFLAPAAVTVLSERRQLAPWGLAGGADGACGSNTLNGVAIPGKCELEAQTGDRLSVTTAGGGGWGRPDHTAYEVFNSEIKI